MVLSPANGHEHEKHKEEDVDTNGFEGDLTSKRSNEACFFDCIGNMCDDNICEFRRLHRTWSDKTQQVSESEAEQYSIGLRLASDDNKSISYFHKTVTALFNEIRAKGWIIDFYFNTTPEVNLQLKPNKHREMESESSFVFLNILSVLLEKIRSYDWKLKIDFYTTRDTNLILYNRENTVGI